jgi:tRNA U34 5-methylaminomethyl-2-thiouridine-forming methyltransferase MnmC
LEKSAQIFLTEDGSNSLYLPEFDETYHSRHGAIQESMHVFIENGLKSINKKNIKILEFGFGTGLNALMTLINSKEKYIEYTGIEKFPLDITLLNQLNYAKSEEELVLFEKIHLADWNKKVVITDDFTLEQIKSDFIRFQSDEKFDIIYFDAFAPRVQPELWTKEIFEKTFRLLSKEGILVTYCAKGSVKRTLKEVGFKVISLPGPPGKREMTKAVKNV